MSEAAGDALVLGIDRRIVKLRQLLIPYVHDIDGDGRQGVDVGGGKGVRQGNRVRLGSARGRVDPEQVYGTTDSLRRCVVVEGAAVTAMSGQLGSRVH